MFAVVKRLWRRDEGSALVEATIITPVLLTLFLGVFEFSWYFYNQQLVEAGVRDAARFMARIRLTGGTTDPCSQNDANGYSYKIDAGCIATNASVATSATSCGGAARVSGWTYNQVSSNIQCLASPTGSFVDGATTMTIIYVTTTVADPSLGFFSTLGLTAPSITVTHQERYIGPG